MLCRSSYRADNKFDQTWLTCFNSSVASGDFQEMVSAHFGTSGLLQLALSLSQCHTPALQQCLCLIVSFDCKDLRLTLTATKKRGFIKNCLSMDLD